MSLEESHFISVILIAFNYARIVYSIDMISWLHATCKQEFMPTEYGLSLALDIYSFSGQKEEKKIHENVS